MFKWKFSTTTEATEQDEELQSLKAIMLVGWPELESEVPIPVQEYWNYREEISLHNGSQRIIIPRVIRPEITTQSHTSHLGIKSCKKSKSLYRALASYEQQH